MSTSYFVRTSRPALAWVLRGGFGRLVVWRPDTKEYVSTTMARPAGVVDDTERETLGSGARRAVRRTRALALDVVAADAVQILDGWAEAGVEVRAALLAATTGRHVLWDEAVPAETAVVGPAPAALSGANFVLHTERFDADVTHSPDLLSRFAFEDGGGWAEAPGSGTVTWSTDILGRPNVVLTGDAEVSAEVVLPAEGLGLCLSVEVVADADRTGYVPQGPSVDGVKLRIEPLRASGASAGNVVTERAFGAPGQTADVVTRLPRGTYSVRVSIIGEGTIAAPALTTRRRDGSAIPLHQLAGVVGIKDRPVDADTDRLVTFAGSSAEDPDGDHVYDVTLPQRAIGPRRKGGLVQIIRSDDE